MLSPQNQNFQYFPSSPWSNVKEVTPQETFELGAKPQYVYVDIHGAEVAELRSRIEKLEERRTQQVIGIQNLDSDKLELKVALVVTIESTEQDGFVVWSEDLNIYGEGKSEGEARSDFLKNVEELYFDLKQDRDKLGPAMERIWKFLQKAIKEV